jgi:membrane-associated phospholipid phosphatase
MRRSVVARRVGARRRRPLGLLLLLLLTAPVGAQAQGSDVVDVAGSALRVFLPAAAWAATYVDGDGEGRTQFYWAMGSTIGVTLATKAVVDREAPDGGRYSFPSGYSSMSFSAASFVHRRYGWSNAWPLYTAAAFVGWSRVHIEEHYWSDVLAGAALGVGFTYLFVEPRPEEGFHVSIQTGGDYYGVSLARRW